MADTYHNVYEQADRDDVILWPLSPIEDFDTAYAGSTEAEINWSRFLEDHVHPKDDPGKANALERVRVLDCGIKSMQTRWFSSMLSELGAETMDVSVPDHREAGGIVWGLIAEGATAYLRSNGMGHHWSGLYNPGLAETLGKSLRAQSNDLPPTVKLVLLMGTYMSEQYHGRMYAKAQNLARSLKAAYDGALNEHDLLLMPTLPMKAPRIPPPDASREEYVQRAFEMLANTCPFNVTGHPAITVPCGMSGGLPVAMMLVGRIGEDATVLRKAGAPVGTKLVKIGVSGDTERRLSEINGHDYAKIFGLSFHMYATQRWNSQQEALGSETN
ncbi:MAG: hypothetical protein IH801_06415, partial [Nitrospinae bacterium]|nr:hypothetical protein [Nitrospinota bacterium]